MKLATACRFTILGIAIFAVGGCGNSQSGSPSPGVATSSQEGTTDDFDVTSPEEARSEAESTIDSDNADEVFEDLQQEIEADLDGGG